MKIGKDKWKHFFVGLAMGLILQGIMMFFFPGHKIIESIIVLVVVTAVGYGFELFSKFSGLGHYDVMDAVFTVLGGVVGIAVVVFCAWVF